MNRRDFMKYGTSAAGFLAGTLKNSLGAELAGGKPGATVETSAGKIRGLVFLGFSFGGAIR